MFIRQRCQQGMAAAYPRRNKMLPEHEAKLRECYDKIEEELEPLDVFHFMFARQIFDLEDKEKIEAGETRHERVLTFMKMLPCRGPDAFQFFLEALRKNSYEDLADRIDAEVRTPIDERLENIERKQKKLEIKINKSLKGPTKLEMKEVMDQITVDRTKYDELLEELELLKQKLRDKEEEIERLQLDQAEEKSRLTQEIQMLRDELEAKTMTLEKLETDVGCLIAREKRMSKEIANIQQNLKLLFNNNNKDSPRRPVVKKYRGRLQDWKP